MLKPEFQLIRGHFQIAVHQIVVRHVVVGIGEVAGGIGGLRDQLGLLRRRLHHIEQIVQYEMRPLVVARMHQGFSETNGDGRIAREQIQRLVQHGLGFLHLAVRQIRLAQRAVELIHLRIFFHERLQIGDGRGGIARRDVRDVLAVALLDVEAGAVLGEVDVVFARRLRIADERSEPLAHQRIAQGIRMANAADLFRAVARLGDAIRENGVIDQELNGIDPARFRPVCDM